MVPLLLDTSIGEFQRVLAEPPPWREGHVTALAWATDRDRRGLLLVEHRLHGWSCPGGHVDEGETPAAAAARELHEETGIDAHPVPGVFTLGRSRGCARADGAIHWSFGYLFVVDRARPLHHETGQKAAWFDLDALPSPRPSDVDRVARRIGDELR